MIGAVNYLYKKIIDYSLFTILGICVEIQIHSVFYN